ncbi:hypothetical protein ABZV93_11975 [Actinopolymorpha sp. NPDC004070]|uniref:hypothetical protein n=1 Tax=Actinopolymorpha sp. NPDC004070 TaxID=3154548 RepID=UPI0033A481F5
MTGISKAQLDSAISAIVESGESEPPADGQARHAELSALRRTHYERLRSEFADADAGFLGRLQALSREYRDEVASVLERRAPTVESGAVEPTRSDREWIDNRKAVYELIAGRPLVTFPVVIDAPVAIYSTPSSSLIDSHIERWGSWATWLRQDVREANWELPAPHFKTASLNFLFAWQNDSANPVVIKRASADLSLRGHCEAIAWPTDWSLVDSNVDLALRAHHRVYLASTAITGYDEYIFYRVAHALPVLLGGTHEDIENVELDLVKHLACHDIVVPSNRLAIFQVGILTEHLIMNGSVNYFFTGSGRRILCPSLALELSLVVHP